MSEAQSGTMIKKSIVPFDQSAPDTEPLFINYIQASHAAGSAYLDVGIISLDDILAGQHDATFHVLSRLVMSKETLTIMKNQIAELLERLDGNGAIPKNAPEA